MADDLYVTKRNLEKERLQRTKILQRVRALTSGLDLRYIDVDGVVDAVMNGSFDGITTVKLDELCAQTAAYSATRHPDYAILAGRLAVTALHKTTPATFLETIKILYGHHNKKTNEPAPLVSQEVYDVVMNNTECLEKAIRHDLDMTYEYFGLKTLERSYLLRVDNGKELVVVERPQYMLMRVSIGIHQHDIPAVLETYSLLAQGAFTHASPTLFNSGTPTPQMSSCFLVAMKEDSIQGIYDTLKTCAMISKCAGGIGVHMHCIRSSGSYIRGTNGTSNGLVPLLRVYNDTARYVDQGGGKRKGAFAVYLEPWHADIFDFLQLKKNTGKEEMRARDLFYGLWIPDLFMKRVQANGMWTLFDPNSSPGLADAWGDEFDALYTRYEQAGGGVRTVEAQQLWFHIIESQIETGTPYMLFKDSCNRKSNQKNLGTIKCSNLCTEIIEYTSPDEVAVCNLASISLPSCVVEKDAVKQFDHEKLKYITMVTTRNLNKVIDRNYYPVEEAKRSNFRHRPIGLGVQGLADAFLLLGLPFTSPEAQQLNEDIFETIYYAALKASCEIAQKDGPYETYPGSPVSQGQLQFDMWNVTPKSGRWPWNELRQEISKHGVRNSLLVAPMPTASTSQILGNNECFEPFTSNIYLRRVLSGEFPIVNKYLVRDLVRLGLWNEKIRNNIIAHNGSIQFVDEIPPQIKTLYRTVWEIKQKDLIDMAAARGAYIDQSQSLNLFLETPTSAQVTSMHFYTWKKGLKTGMYYLRSRPAADAIKFTVDQSQVQGDQKVPPVSSQETQEGCISCGS